MRCVPASIVERIEWREGDYEAELRYKEVAAAQGAQRRRRWWVSPLHPSAADLATPVMLHYAVNRPVGALRGESDLAPILPWLKRYSRWLEDRVRLNAGVRAFLWVVKAPARLRTELAERYRQPPEPGSVIIADEQEIVDGRRPQPQRQRRGQRRAGDPLDDRRRRAGDVAAGFGRGGGLEPRDRPGDDGDAAAVPAPAAGVPGVAADGPGAGRLAPLCVAGERRLRHNVTAADITAVLPDIRSRTTRSWRRRRCSWRPA